MATGLLLASTAVVGTLVAGTGPAAAAQAAELKNTYEGYFPGATASSWNSCYASQYNNNYAHYGNGNGSENEYFYCADGGDKVNLWWRHYV